MATIKYKTPDGYKTIAISGGGGGDATPLKINFGAEFPTTTKVGTIADTGYTAEEIIAAIDSGKGVLLTDTNSNTLFISYYTHQVTDGKNSLGLQAVRHTNDGYINLSLIFTDSRACVWMSDSHTLQEELVSGSNIKTINNQSILGMGNITIEGGGGGITLDSEMSDTSTNAVSNKVIKEYVDSFIPADFNEDFNDDFTN